MKVSNTYLLTLSGLVGGTVCQALSSGINIPISKEEWRGLFTALFIALIGYLAEGTKGSVKKGAS